MQDMESNDQSIEREDNVINDFLNEINRPLITNHCIDYSTSAKMLSINDEISKDLENKDKSTDICLKRIYGYSILLILFIWEVFVITFSYKQLNPCSFQIRYASDEVIIVLLTTASANILFLPGIVLKYLFPNSNKK